MRKDFYNRSRPDNDRIRDLFCSRGSSVIERWNWFQSGHTLRSGKRGWISGRRVTAGIAINLHGIQSAQPKYWFVSLRLRRSGPPSIFLSGFVCHRSSSRNKRRRFSIARNLGHTALLEPTGRLLTKRIDSESVGRPALPTRAFGGFMAMTQSFWLKHYTEQNKSLRWMFFTKRG